MNALSIGIGLLAGLGAAVAAVGIQVLRATDATMLARQRLARQDIALGGDLAELELERPLSERLMMPVRRGATNIVNRFTPTAQAARLRERLDMAGSPFGLDPPGVQTLRVATGAAAGALGTALGLISGQPVALVLFLVGGFIAGFYLPNLWLGQMIRQRMHKLEAVLPDSLDVIAISMKAGLSLDRALEQLVRYEEGPFTEVVQHAMQQIEFGRPRAEALEEMAESMGMEDFTALVRSIVHAERGGVPIADAIEAHAAQMRVRRRLKIRTEAAQASLKMLLPTVGCVFPTLWLILLGPALILAVSLSHR